MSACCRAPPPSATTRRISSALVERVSDHLAAPGHELPRERLWQVRAKRVMIATGAIERHMVFADNDRPGIMLASAARTYLNHYGVAVGKNVGVYTANDSAYAAAIDLKKAGVNVAGIVDIRDNPTGPAVDEARGARHRDQPRPRRHPRRRQAARVVDDGAGQGRRTGAHHPGRRDPDVGRLDAVGAPVLAVARQGRLRRRDASASCPASTRRTASRSAPRNGTDGLAETIAEALAAGEKAAKDAGGKSGKGASLSAETSESWAGGMLGAAPGAGADTTVKAFVDFQNDVTAKDIRLAVREGMRSIEHVKRFTTNGMATDQGKTSNMHGLAIAAETLGKEIPEVGLTTFRAPYTPVTFGAIVNHGRGAAVRSDAQDGDPSVGGSQRRGVRGCRPVEARLVFPEAGRGHARRGRPRMRDRAQDAPACSTPRRSARSRWSGRTRRSSWNCSTPTRGRSWSPAAAAMASCCARTASSMTTAWSAGWRRTASM